MNDFMMKDICRNDDNRLLKVEVFESSKNGNHKKLGETELSIKEITVDNKKIFTVFNKKVIAGSLEVYKCQFLNRYTFLDYIHGGCDISLMLAMDFTLSNKVAKDSKSLHYIDPVLTENKKIGNNQGMSPT